MPLIAPRFFITQERTSPRSHASSKVVRESPLNRAFGLGSLPHSPPGRVAVAMEFEPPSLAELIFSFCISSTLTYADDFRASVFNFSEILAQTLL